MVLPYYPGQPSPPAVTLPGRIIGPSVPALGTIVGQLPTWSAGQTPGASIGDLRTLEWRGNPNSSQPPAMVLPYYPGQPSRPAKTLPGRITTPSIPNLWSIGLLSALPAAQTPPASLGDVRTLEWRGNPNAAQVLPALPGEVPSQLTRPQVPILEWSVPNPYTPALPPLLLPWLPLLRSAKTPMVLPAVSAWTASTSTGGPGGGQTGCCPNMPAILHATVNVLSGSCSCLSGLVVPLRGNPAGGWAGSVTTSCAAANKTVTLTFRCPPPAPRCNSSSLTYDLCGFQGSASSPAACNCDPGMLFTFGPIAATACCGGLATISVLITR